MTFPARRIHVVTSATVRGRDPDLAGAHRRRCSGSGRCRPCGCSGASQPSAVVGFGGYPTVPPVLAATLRKIPTLIHEQNAVMGRANRLLAARVKRSPPALPACSIASRTLAAKATRTGNPVRPAVIAAATMPYAVPRARRSASVSSCSAAARARASWPTSCRLRSSGSSRICRSRLSVVQQAREEDVGAGPRHLRAGEGGGRGRAVLHRPAGADRGRPSRRLALGRLDRGRTGGDRAAGDPGAAAACARPGPGRQCRRAGNGGRRRMRLRAGRFHARPAGGRNQRACQRAGKTRSNGRGRPLAGRDRRRRAAGRSGGCRRSKGTAR